MHFPVFPLGSAPARLALLTVCALLPVFPREAAAGGVQPPHRGRSGVASPPPPAPAPAHESTPYLLVGPPPDLRFAAPVPIAAPVLAAAAAPGPPGSADPDQFPEAPPAPDPASATIPAAAPQAAPPVTNLSASSFAASSPDSSPDSVPIATEPPQIGVTILPDDTPRPIRSEDVLVYFRFPRLPVASSSDTPPPRSSATYQQP